MSRPVRLFPGFRRANGLRRRRRVLQLLLLFQLRNGGLVALLCELLKGFVGLRLHAGRIQRI